jgi:hypothetical protein
MGNWLRTNATLIAAIKDLVTIVAAPAALISVFFAIWQLDLASSQLITTANSIKSNTIYQISHEGREISREIAKGPPDESKVGLVLNFTHSLWQQHRLGTIDDSIWLPITEELCSFLHRYDISRYWTPATQKWYAQGYVDFINERGKQCQ